MDARNDMNIDPGLRETSPEWEYEYSNTETEDFYVIIDMPPSRSGKEQERMPAKQPSMFVEARDVRTAQKKRKLERQHQVRRRRRRNRETGELEPLPAIAGIDAADAEDGDGASVLDPMTPETINDEVDEDVQTENGDGPEQNATSKDIEAEDNDGDDLLRLWNLSSDNPLLHYKDRLFQLQWANGLGTDMYFVKRQDNERPAQGALQSFGSWDLVGCSGARLVASEARFKYKGRSATTVSGKAESSSFLRRLVELQVQKGEVKREDVVFPEGRAGQHVTDAVEVGVQSRMALDMLMGQIDETDDGKPVVVSGKRRGKRRSLSGR